MTDAQGEPFTAWITKYALTKGIYEVEATLIRDLRVSCQSHERYRQSYHGSDWHTSKESALVRAEKMRATRIAWHEKSITKLRAVQFS